MGFLPSSFPAGRKTPGIVPARENSLPFLALHFLQIRNKMLNLQRIKSPKAFYYE